MLTSVVADLLAVQPIIFSRCFPRGRGPDLGQGGKAVDSGEASMQQER